MSPLKETPQHFSEEDARLKSGGKVEISANPNVSGVPYLNLAFQGSWENRLTATRRNEVIKSTQIKFYEPDEDSMENYNGGYRVTYQYFHGLMQDEITAVFSKYAQLKMQMINQRQILTFPQGLDDFCVINIARRERNSIRDKFDNVSYLSLGLFRTLIADKTIPSHLESLPLKKDEIFARKLYTGGENLYFGEPNYLGDLKIQMSLDQNLRPDWGRDPIYSLRIPSIRAFIDSHALIGKDRVFTQACSILIDHKYLIRNQLKWEPFIPSFMRD